MTAAIEELWQDGEPTEYGYEVYTEGDCWLLSYALFRCLPGSKVQLLGDPQTRYWAHAVVQVAVDTYLDVNGLSDQATLFKWWGGAGVKTIWEPVWASDDVDAFQDFKAALGVKDTLFLPTPSDAFAMAGRLIAKHQPSKFTS